VSAGLHLNSLLRAFVVVLLGGIALVIGLTMFLSAIGLSSMGVPASV
jgi:hypothetical protein